MTRINTNPVEDEGVEEEGTKLIGLRVPSDVYAMVNQFIHQYKESTGVKLTRSDAILKLLRRHGLVGSDNQNDKRSSTCQTQAALTPAVHVLCDCFLTIANGSLLTAAMNQDGSIDRDENGEVNWGEVTAPESQNFLDAVNNLYGTEFRMNQFKGR